jgi:hypothetical protein
MFARNMLSLNEQNLRLAVSLLGPDSDLLGHARHVRFTPDSD